MFFVSYSTFNLWNILIMKSCVICLLLKTEEFSGFYQAFIFREGELSLCLISIFKGQSFYSLVSNCSPFVDGLQSQCRLLMIVELTR